MPAIFSEVPPAGTSYGNGYVGGYVPRLALNACGDGALIVGIADPANNDTHDGLFTSSTTACGSATRPANSSPPTVSGTKTVGQKLSASTGAWSGTAPITYAYQWQRCAPGCVNIAGATANTYTLGGADQGGKVRVAVTASNGAGSATATSALAGPIGPSSGAIKSALGKALSPSGKLAKIAAILKHKGFTLSFKAPSGGALTISWYLVPKGAHLSAAKPVLVAKGRASSGKAGTVKITVKLTSGGKKLLKHSHKLKLTAKGSFKLTGGATVSTSKSFTLKG